MKIAVLITALLCLVLLPVGIVMAAATGGSGGGQQPSGGGQPPTGGGQQQSGGGQQSPSNYLSYLYVWFLGFVGISAMFAIVMGGVMYMFAGANLTKTEEAKKWITNAIWGIVLAAVSVLLLRTINPNLVQGFSFEEVVNNAIQKIKIK